MAGRPPLYTPLWYSRRVSETVVYRVPGISCEHCEAVIRHGLGAVAGVEDVSVDLERKVVTVQGNALSDVALRAAIAAAEYEVE